MTLLAPMPGRNAMPPRPRALPPQDLQPQAPSLRGPESRSAFPPAPASPRCVPENFVVPHSPVPAGPPGPGNSPPPSSDSTSALLPPGSASAAHEIFVAASWLPVLLSAATHWRARVGDLPPIRAPILAWRVRIRRCAPVSLPVPGNLQTVHASILLQSRSGQKQTHLPTDIAPPDSWPARASQLHQVSRDTLSGAA